MNNSPLDDHIKKQFGNYSPDVPPHIWEKIAAKKDKRKPVGFWFGSLNKSSLFLLLGLLLLGTGAVMYNHFNTTTDTDKTSTTVSINKTGIKETNTPNNSLTEKVLSENSEKEKTITAEKEPSQISQSTVIQKDPVSQANSNRTFTGSKNKTTVSDKQKDDVVSNTTIDNVAEKNPTINRFSKSKRSKGKTSISLKNAAALSDDDYSTKNTFNTNDLLLSRLLLDPDLLSTERNILNTVKKPTFSYLNVPCPESEKNAAGNKRYFEIYGGPDYAFRNITDTGNSAYLQKRKESTKFTSAFSVGLRYTKVFNNGMSFRTGINYSQINEKFKYAEGNIIQIIYITDMNGDTTGSYTSSVTRYKTTHNKYRTLDIPLMIGYELGNGRLHANFNAGAIVNLYSWQKGDLLDTAFNPINITTGKTSSPYQFRTNVGVGFIGAVSVYYKLTSRLHIMAEPYFRYNFSPVSKSDLTLKQKYNTAGLRLGVRIDF